MRVHEVLLTWRLCELSAADKAAIEEFISKLFPGPAQPKADDALKPVIVVEGYVYCDGTGGIHDDTLDPYGYGEGDAHLCTPDMHHPVFKDPETA